jgi:hypothetical protein
MGVPLEGLEEAGAEASQAAQLPVRAESAAGALALEAAGTAEKDSGPPRAKGSGRWVGVGQASTQAKTTSTNALTKVNAGFIGSMRNRMIKTESHESHRSAPRSPVVRSGGSDPDSPERFADTFLQ